MFVVFAGLCYSILSCTSLDHKGVHFCLLADCRPSYPTPFQGGEGAIFPMLDQPRSLLFLDRFYELVLLPFSTTSILLVINFEISASCKAFSVKIISFVTGRSSSFIFSHSSSTCVCVSSFFPHALHVRSLWPFL